MLDKSSNGDHNFYPHKPNMGVNCVKDDDSCDVVCSRSISDEDTDDACKKIAAVDEPRMDWLMFKYK